MHKFFFAPAVCANKKIPCQCILRIIESQPSLIGGPARTEKQGKLELKEHAPTPTPPLLPLSLTNPTNPQVTNPKLLNPQIHLKLVKEESWPKNVRCQQNLESWERKKKKLETWTSCKMDLDSAFDPTSISPMNNACYPPDPPITFGDKSQPSNLKLIGMSIWCQRWRCEAEFLKVENLEIPRLWIPIGEIPKPGQNSRPFCEAYLVNIIYNLVENLLWRCSNKADLVYIVAGDDKWMPISIMVLVLTDRC